MRDTLAQEVEVFLRASGPATSPEIALALRARRMDVDRVLAEGPFAVAPGAEGRHGNAKAWVSSSVVPSRRVAHSRRAELMLKALRDGRWHSRAEIFDRAGGYFLTNNAAVEIREIYGHTVEFGWGPGRLPQYRLRKAAAMRTPRPVSVSGEPAALKVVAA